MNYSEPFKLWVERVTKLPYHEAHRRYLGVMFAGFWELFLASR